MTKAKSAIDKLAQLPPFDPTSVEPPQDLAEHPEASRFQMEEFQPATAAPSNLGFYPNQDLCLSLQNPGLVHGQASNPAAMFPVGFDTGAGSSWVPEPEMGHFSRLLAWNGGGYAGERPETLHSSFHPIRAWDDLPMAIPKLELQQQQQQQASMGFCIPAQMQGGGRGGGEGEDVHGINLAYHQNHNHNPTSSMSTDSSR